MTVTSVMSRLLQTSRTGKLLRQRAGILIVIGVVFSFPAYTSWAGQLSTRRLQAPTSDSPFGGLSDIDPALARQQLRALNALRQKKLVEDTNKLLKLAQTLNAQVQSGHYETLTVAQLKEVKRIEKLAHSVREKMAQTYGGGPSLAPIIMPTTP